MLFNSHTMKDSIIKSPSDKGSTKFRRSLCFIIVQFSTFMTRWCKFLNKWTEKQRTVWTQESGDTKHSFDRISHTVNLSHYLCLHLFLIFLRKRDGKTHICYVAVATCCKPFPESISCPWCSSHAQPISCQTGKLRSTLSLINLCVRVCLSVCTGTSSLFPQTRADSRLSYLTSCPVRKQETIHSEENTA